MEATGMSSTFFALVPMLIFGVIYLAVFIAVLVGFVSIVLSLRRIAATQERTLAVLTDISSRLLSRGTGQP